MECHEARQLVSAYVDAELDPAKNLEIDRHVQACAACAQALADLEGLRARVKNDSTYFHPPPGLRSRIQASLPRERYFRPAIWSLPRLPLAVAASLLVGAIAGWGLGLVLPPRPSGAPLSDELIASHVRSGMLPGHRVDIESSDQHTVKPWFEGKVDFAPPVPQLRDEGFPLIGGRLDYFDGKRVAALVYQRRQHFMNVFIWRSDAGGEPGAHEGSRQNFHMVHWTQAGLSFWAVSDLNAEELREFGRLFQEKTR